MTTFVVLTYVVVPLIVKLPGTTISVEEPPIVSVFDAPTVSKIVLSPAAKSKSVKPTITAIVSPNEVSVEPIVIPSFANFEFDQLNQLIENL